MKSDIGRKDDGESGERQIEVIKRGSIEGGGTGLRCQAKLRLVHISSQPSHDFHAHVSHGSQLDHHKTLASPRLTASFEPPPILPSLHRVVFITHFEPSTLQEVVAGRTRPPLQPTRPKDSSSVLDPS